MICCNQLDSIYQKDLLKKSIRIKNYNDYHESVKDQCTMNMRTYYEYAF